MSKVVKKAIIFLSIILIIINIGLLPTKAVINRDDILGYQTRINNLSSELVAKLPRLNNYLNTYKEELKRIYDKELLINVITKFEAKSYGLGLDLIINKLSGNAKTDLTNLKTDLIILLTNANNLESELRTYINDNISEITFTDLFPVTDALNNLYRTNRVNLKSVGSHIKTIIKYNIDLTWDGYDNLSITQLINNLSIYVDDVKNNLLTYDSIQTKMNSWTNIIAVLDLDEILIVTNLKTDYNSATNRITNGFDNLLNNYFESLHISLNTEVNSILNSTDTVDNKNTRVSDIIEIYDNAKEKVLTKHAELLTYTDVTKIVNVLNDNKTILITKIDEEIAFLVSKLQESTIDITNVITNDKTNLINYNENYFITKNLYKETTINSIIKINNNDGYIRFTNLQNNKLATNSNINVYNENNVLLKTYKVVVKGDVVGNGLFNVNDVRLINAHILKQTTLNGIYYEAGDLTDDGVLNVNDARMLNQKIIDKEGI